jgi:transcription initiation factor TFIID TATA-box-binding protein
VSADLEKSVDLEEATRILDGAIYEPEGFPGVIYKWKEANISFLIFSSGRVVCVGAKTMEEAYEAIRKLKEQLSLAKKRS